jgi:orotidine-5'-phosphate decarboxylase
MTGAGLSEAKRREAARRLMVALDFADADDARRLVGVLSGLPVIYKIGLEMLFAEGLGFVRETIAAGSQVFLDAKFLDIPNTVEKATASAARLGASFLTVHASDRKTLDAAVTGRGASGMKLLGVTVLTSLAPADLAEQGIAESPAELVLRRALLARDAGFDGVIASPQEAAAIRAATGSGFLIVTPGIRPTGAALGDQQRVLTPADAIAAGADHLVVGRPITAAPDPAQAARQIIADIATALPA